jgi:hypothetical protein
VSKSKKTKLAKSWQKVAKNSQKVVKKVVKKLSKIAKKVVPCIIGHFMYQGKPFKRKNQQRW